MLRIGLLEIIVAREIAMGLAWLSLLVSWSCSSESGSAVEGSEEPVEIPRDFYKVRVAYAGSGSGWWPPGSTCGQDFVNELEFARDDFELSWQVCLSESAAAPAAPVRARRSLTSLEFDDIRDTFDGIQLSSSTSCGDDASVLTLDVHVGLTVDLYADDFYAGCPSEHHAGRRFVTGLEQLERVLRGFVETAP
jgi:hypothetical protein